MNINSSFQLEQVAIGTIEKMLKLTNANKTAGIDGLPGLFLKDGAEILVPPVTQIVNL